MMTTWRNVYAELFSHLVNIDTCDGFVCTILDSQKQKKNFFSLKTNFCSRAKQLIIAKKKKKKKRRKKPQTHY